MILIALAGAAVTAAVMALGLGAIAAVSALRPRWSLLIALLTYALELLVLTVVFARVLPRVGLDADDERLWFAAGVVAAVLAWSAAHLWVATHRRIPAFDERDPRHIG